MSTNDESIASRPGVDWGRAEFILVGLGVLGFVTLLIRITTIYSGLPAHPLFVHVPVVLIPVTLVAAVALMVRPDWLRGYGQVVIVEFVPNEDRVTPPTVAGFAVAALAVAEGPLEVRPGGKMPQDGPGDAVPSTKLS